MPHEDDPIDDLRAVGMTAAASVARVAETLIRHAQQTARTRAEQYARAAEEYGRRLSARADVAEPMLAAMARPGWLAQAGPRDLTQGWRDAQSWRSLNEQRFGGYADAMTKNVQERYGLDLDLVRRLSGPEGLDIAADVLHARATRALGQDPDRSVVATVRDGAGPVLSMESAHEAHRAALAAAVVADPALAGTTVAQWAQDGAPAWDGTLAVRETLAGRMPAEALDVYARHFDAGLSDEQALAETREMFRPGQEWDQAGLGAQLRDDPVAREFLGRAELREAYARNFGAVSLDGDGSVAQAAAVDAFVEFLDGGEPGRFTRDLGAATERALAAGAAPEVMQGLGEAELMVVGERLSSMVLSEYDVAQLRRAAEQAQLAADGERAIAAEQLLGARVAATREVSERAQESSATSHRDAGDHQLAAAVARDEAGAGRGDAQTHGDVTEELEGQAAGYDSAARREGTEREMREGGVPAETREAVMVADHLNGADPRGAAASTGPRQKPLAAARTPQAARKQTKTFGRTR